MSLSSPVVELRTSRLSSNYLLSIIPVAILYYDYALTFSREVELFWPHESRHGIGWVEFFFFLNRYLAFFGHIPIALGLFMRGSLADEQFCKGMRSYYGYLGMALQSIVAILIAMRVFALYNKNYHLLGVLVTLIGASVITGGVAIATEAGDAVVPHHIHGCSFCLALSDEGGQFLSIAWGGVMAFDITVFVLTLYKAIRVGRNVPLIHRLLRDGSVYFFVLFTVNLANILTLLHAPVRQFTLTDHLESIYDASLPHDAPLAFKTYYAPFTRARTDLGRRS
ncbi:hypothetical protein BGW80DRAFT_1345058 [Lactifluus volemus]|nr:hypothetical protein BGW80DRAFT_1345058 [Lactifluus volemus]